VNPATTIAAPCSPPGHAPRAIIRLSGPGVADVLNALLAGGDPGARGVFRGVFRLDQLQLPVLLVRSLAPASYTGEESAEILLPGNPALVERALQAIIARGAVLAAPGEFSARAVLNGRVSLAQAEGVAATIGAATEDQLRAAAGLRSGALGARAERWADELTTLLALVEAGIDFTDQEDVVPIAPSDLRSRLLAVAVDAEQALGAPAEAPGPLPAVALVGAPNAGKSTLFNRLLGRARAVAGPTAGLTRDVLSEELDLGPGAPGPVVLQDMAGLSESAAGVADAGAQRAAAEAIGRADLLVWCDPAGRFDERLLPGASRRRVLRVRTFADRPGADGSADLAVCALDGWNLGPLKRAVAEQAWAGRSRASGVAALLPRWRSASSGLITAAREAASQCAAGRIEPEVVAESLRAAVVHAGELCGRISPDDILARVFGAFCVGK